MPETNTTLYLKDSTTTVDVLDFVADRLESPTRIDDDIVVFNFHNAPLSLPELSEWARDAESGVYVSPYQVSGVWAFIIQAIPSEVAQARLLAFRPNSQEYVDYPNWRADWLQADREFDVDIADSLSRIHQIGMGLKADGVIEPSVEGMGDDFTIRENPDHRFEWVVEDHSRDVEIGFSDRADALLYATISTPKPVGGDE